MDNQQFDERYPAMFQPGGEAVQAGAQWPVMPGATPAPATSPGVVSATSTTPQQHLHREAAPAGLGHAGPAESVSPAKAASAAPATSPRFLWHVPTIVGGVLLLMGVLLPVVPYWIIKPSGLPDDYYLSGAMWSYVATQAAAPMIGVGLGVLATVLFGFAQQHQTRREGLRRLFTVASAAVLAAGLYAQFAHIIHPPLRHENVDENTGMVSWYESPSAFVSVLGMLAFATLLVGLLMFAALAVSHNFSLIRGYAVGLLLVGAAVFSQFAQKIFPNVPLSTQYYEGGTQSIPGWPSMLPMLMPALVAAGVIVIAAVALGPAIAATLRAPRAVPKVEQPDDETIAVEQEEDHVQPEL